MTDDALAELLTLTMTVGECGDTEYRNHLGQRHRIHGPAVIWADGDKWWIQNGQLHRTDGPAVILSNGSRYWYLNGNIHRTDGPAYVSPSYGRYWFLYGEPFTEKEYNERVKSI